VKRKHEKKNMHTLVYDAIIFSTDQVIDAEPTSYIEGR
jgi:hypothetical protein